MLTMVRIKYQRVLTMFILQIFYFGLVQFFPFNKYLSSAEKKLSVILATLILTIVIMRMLILFSSKKWFSVVLASFSTWVWWELSKLIKHQMGMLPRYSESIFIPSFISLVLICYYIIFLHVLISIPSIRSHRLFKI